MKAAAMITGATEDTTPIVHYYRGELSRMITWRDRLDHTTNWAIAATAAMLSVALASPTSHHAVILCCMTVVLLLLLIETRRYRFFDLSRRRIRLLEQNYFAHIIDPSAPGQNADWGKQLSSDLQFPRYQLSMLDAMRNRIRRNYFWIYVPLLCSWWLKVTTVVLDARIGKAVFVSSYGQLADNADVSYIPGTVVIAGVTLSTLVLVAMAVAPWGQASGENAEEADV